MKEGNRGDEVKIERNRVLRERGRYVLELQKAVHYKVIFRNFHRIATQIFLYFTVQRCW